MLTNIFKKLFLTGILLASWLVNFAQQDDWVRIYGDDINNAALQIIETYDGGYIIGGHTLPHSGGFIKDGFLIKTDINGEILWQKIIGGGADDRIDGNYVQQTYDGGYILLSGTSNYGYTYDVFIMKLNKCGEKEWSKVFFDNDEDQYPLGIVQMPDSSYLMMLA